MKKKILIVGCSFSHKVWDANNKVEECWPEWITKELGDKIQIMNLSMPGASNELIKRIVQGRVIVMQPENKITDEVRSLLSK